LTNQSIRKRCTQEVRAFRLLIGQEA